MQNVYYTYIARSKDQTTPFHSASNRKGVRISIYYSAAAGYDLSITFLVDRSTRLFIQTVLNHSHNNFGANFDTFSLRLEFGSFEYFQDESLMDLNFVENSQSLDGNL